MLYKNLENKIKDKSLAKKFFTFLLVLIFFFSLSQVFTPLAGATTYSYSGGSTSSTPASSYSYSNGSSAPSTSYSYSSGSSAPSTSYSYSSGSAAPSTSYSYSSGSATPSTSYSYSNGSATPSTSYSYSSGSATPSTSYSYSSGSATPSTSYSYSTGGCTTPPCTSYTYSTGECTSPCTTYTYSTGECTSPCTSYIYTPVSSCTHECGFTGQHQCSGTSGRTCGNYDSDLCLEWSNWQSCDTQCFYCGNGTCDSGCGENSTNCSQDCGVSCTNECSTGQHQCSGTSGRTCGNHDSDSCLEWSNWQSCDTQCFYCGNGTCNSGCGENSTNCSQDCGSGCLSHSTKQCYLNDSYWYNSCGARESKYEECGDDSCLSWSGNYCYLGDVYRQRTCYDRGCAGGLCYSDSYSDRELVEQCDSDETCQNGDCIIIAGDIRLGVEKTARNLTKGEQTWQETVFANPLDQVQFRIVITSLGTDSLENLILIDSLPAQLDLIENSVRIDGIPTSKNILTGAHLKDIDTGEYCRVEFTTVVASGFNFNYGLTSLTNTSQVSNGQVTDSDTATVKVARSQVAGVSTVATGTGNKWLDYFILPLVIALAGVLLLRKQFILIRKWLSQRKKQALDYRAQQTLKKLSSEAR